MKKIEENNPDLKNQEESKLPESESESSSTSAESVVVVAKYNASEAMVVEAMVVEATAESNNSKEDAGKIFEYVINTKSKIGVPELLAAIQDFNDLNAKVCFF